MATTLRALAGDLGSAVNQVDAAWEGLAHQGFARRWEQLHEPVRQGADTFEHVAASLDAVANQIEETNEQVHQLYATVGITVAIGAVSSAVTFGVGSAGAAAAAAAQAGQAASVVARLGTFLTISARTMSGFRAAFVAFSQRWAIAAAGNALAGAAQRAVATPNHNPLENWSIADVTRTVVSATSSAGVGTVAAGSPHLASLGSGHPRAAVFSGGFVANGTGSVVNDLWVDRRPLSLATARNGLVNGVAGGGSTMATNSVLRPPRLLAVRRPGLWLPRSAVAREALVSIPVDGAVQGLATAPFLPPPAPSPAPPRLPAAPHLVPAATR